jgi:hypothetical protein
MFGSIQVVAIDAVEDAASVDIAPPAIVGAGQCRTEAKPDDTGGNAVAVPTASPAAAPAPVAPTTPVGPTAHDYGPIAHGTRTTPAGMVARGAAMAGIVVMPIATLRTPDTRVLRSIEILPCVHPTMRRAAF